MLGNILSFQTGRVERADRNFVSEYSTQPFLRPGRPVARPGGGGYNPAAVPITSLSEAA